MQTVPLTPEEVQRVNHDLDFIKRITEQAKQLDYRMIIGGGYAVDGALGQITRPHNDLDIQLYGQKPGTEATTEIISSLDLSLLPALTDKGRKDFWHYFHLQLPHTLAELYYLQVTTDPFAEKKIIIKADGAHAPSHGYDTRTVTLEGAIYEAQNPAAELADKLYKREYRGDPKQAKHEQDIHNLRLIVSKAEEEEALEAMKNR